MSAAMSAPSFLPFKPLESLQKFQGASNMAPPTRQSGSEGGSPADPIDRVSFSAEALAETQQPTLPRNSGGSVYTFKKGSGG